MTMTLEEENERLKAALLDIQGIAESAIRTSTATLLRDDGVHLLRATIRELGFGNSKKILRRISELDERTDTDRG